MQVVDISTHALRESKTNPRQTFRHLEDLAKSFAEKGQLTPIVVRPLPANEKNGITHEIVCGARRYRAATIAKLPKLAAVVREDLDDKSTLELQIVENDMREDVHPLEQAEGYDALRKLGYAVEQIAAKVSRTPAFVHRALKLCELIPEAKAALLAERIVAGVAQLIARIPDKAAQKKALEQLMPQDPEGDDLDGHYIECRPATVPEAQALLREHFMIKLELAPFDRGDAQLAPKAGACTNCPKRTGSQAQLFGDVEPPDLCTDPSCYRDKCKAQWAVLQKTAKETGTKLLTEAQCKKILQVYPNRDGVAVVYGSGYVSADSTRYLGGKRQTVAEIVGKDVKPTLGLAPNGEIVKLYTVDEVDKREKSVQRTSGSSSSKSKSTSSADKAHREKRALEKVQAAAVMGAIVAKAEKAPLTDTHLRLLVACFDVQAWRLEGVTDRRKLEAPLRSKNKSAKAGACSALALKLKGGELVGLVVELALTAYSERALLDAACDIYKVDADGIRAKAKADLAVARASKLAKPKKASPKAVAKTVGKLKAKHKPKAKAVKKAAKK